MVSVVVFDAFGTLIPKARRRANPYSRLIGLGSGEKPTRMPILTRNVAIDVFAEELGVGYLVPILRREIQQEIDGLTLYPDVAPTLAQLKGAGYRVAVCSNLAFEYCAAVRTILPTVDEYIFSCEVGAAKPDPEIYFDVCKRMSCRPRDVLFVGDSKKADLEGPEAFGMSARLLDRGLGQSLLSVLLGVLETPRPN